MNDPESLPYSDNYWKRLTFWYTAAHRTGMVQHTAQLKTCFVSNHLTVIVKIVEVIVNQILYQIAVWKQNFHDMSRVLSMTILFSSQSKEKIINPVLKSPKYGSRQYDVRELWCRMLYKIIQGLSSNLNQWVHLLRWGRHTSSSLHRTLHISCSTEITSWKKILEVD